MASITLSTTAVEAAASSVVTPVVADAKTFAADAWTAIKGLVSEAWSATSLSAFAKVSIVVGLLFGVGWVIKTGQVEGVAHSVSQVNTNLKAIDDHLVQLINLEKPKGVVARPAAVRK